MTVPCTECTKVFKMATNMYRHRKREHGGTSSSPSALPDHPPVSIPQQTKPALQSGRMPPLIEDSDDEDDTNQPQQLRKNK